MDGQSANRIARLNALVRHLEACHNCGRTVSTDELVTQCGYDREYRSAASVKRQMQRDIQLLSDTFGLEIEFDRGMCGYRVHSSGNYVLYLYLNEKTNATWFQKTARSIPERSDRV